jgi:TIR domain-containing protein
MKIFASYTRDDEGRVSDIAASLQRLGHAVWIDRELTLAQQWWTEVLEQIEDCDALLVAVSPRYLVARACRAEWMYAAALRKPLLVVTVAPVDLQTLPVELANWQVVDGSQPTQKFAIELARGVRDLEFLPAAEPPDPLPPRPAAPISTWNELRDLVYASSLTEAQQFYIAPQLLAGIHSTDSDENRLAGDLGRQFLSRHDLFPWFRTLLQIELDPIRPPPPAPPLRVATVIVGAAMGGLAITHLFWATGLYPLLKTRGIIFFSLAVAMLGLILCLTQIRANTKAALLGSAFCLLGILGAVLDAFKVGIL